MNASIHLPEGCSFTKAAGRVFYRIAHVTRDEFGNYSERLGWLIHSVKCEDDSRVCIQYDNKDIYIDVPAIEVVLLGGVSKS